MTTTFDSLDDLFDAMKADEDIGDWSQLQVWGTKAQEPADTNGIWSWDETRLIVGTCSDDIRIVSREDYDWEREQVKARRMAMGYSC